jgi:acyl carrier protein
VKTNIGHLDAAAGVAGLIKTVLALEHHEIPPTLHFRVANRAMQPGSTPFHVPGRLEKWPESAQPRYAGVSSFGIGGTNAHVVIEEAPAVARRESPYPWHILPVSARSPEALQQACLRLAERLQSSAAPALADAAFTLQLGRTEFAWRRAVICRDAAEAASQLANNVPGVLSRESPQVVFWFGGKEAYPGMGQELRASEPVFRAGIEEYEALARDEKDTPEAALLCFEYALARLWSSWGVRPTAQCVPDELPAVVPGRVVLYLAPGNVPDCVCSLPEQNRAPEEFQILNALGRLWERGVAIDWGQIDRDGTARRVPLPSYPFERRRHWIEYRPPQTDAREDNRAAAAHGKARAIEEELIAIWEEILGESGIAPRDNFFDRNGDSLVATLLLSRIRDRFACDISMGDFFENPTVEALAAHIRASETRVEASSRPRITALPASEQQVASFAQQRLWFIDRLEPGNPAYNITLAIRALGELDRGVLGRAITEIVRRHTVLRTTFAAINGVPVPVVSPPQPLDLESSDLSATPDDMREPEIEALCRAESLRPFDLSHGPLVRFKLIQLSAAQHLLLIGVHHVVFDVWSSAVFFRELADLYRAFCDGRESPLPPLAAQYADFAAWQRDLFESGRMEADTAYWKRKLAGDLPRPAPPPDFAPQRKRGSAGAAEACAIPAALAAAIRSYAAHCGATPFMVLVAAYCAVLSKLSGTREIVMGTDIANRNHPETEAMIGFFVNQLVLRIDFSGNPDAAGMVRLVKETALEAFAHQDLPFDRLVDAINPPRVAGEWPLFAAKFVMRNVRMPVVNIEGLTFEPVEIPRLATTFDFVLTAVEDGQAILLGLDYRTDLYASQTIRDFLMDYIVALEWVTSASDLSLASFEDRLRQTDAERRSERAAMAEQARARAIRSAGRRAVAIAGGDQIGGA